LVSVKMERPGEGGNRGKRNVWAESWDGVGLKANVFVRGSAVGREGRNGGKEEPVRMGKRKCENEGAGEGWSQVSVVGVGSCRSRIAREGGLRRSHEELWGKGRDEHYGGGGGRT